MGFMDHAMINQVLLVHIHKKNQTLSIFLLSRMAVTTTMQIHGVDKKKPFIYFNL